MRSKASYVLTPETLWINEHWMKSSRSFAAYTLKANGGEREGCLIRGRSLDISLTAVARIGGRPGMSSRYL